jgi:high-affinity K+ transport system ATPase subunit B
VNPGDLIATDGEIIEGLATIDEVQLHGESAPVIREQEVINRRLQEEEKYYQTRLK